MPEKAQNVLRRKVRYKVLHGGRGSGKSYAFANYLIFEALGRKRILCTRELQTSIRDSVHRLLCDRIYAMDLQDFFVLGKDTIRSLTGSEFIFRGLKNNISEIKSIEGIDYCWCEEAEKISQDSWDVLVPSIRKPSSEILVSFNPESETSATYLKFIKSPPPDCARSELLYLDNLLFPDVLRKEMEYDLRVDPEKHAHVWLGKPRAYAHACIFKNKIFVEDFDEPVEGTQFYYGSDFGFSNDPCVLGRMFIRDNCLYICDEAYGVGVEIDELDTFFRSVPGSRDWRIVADSQRPDTISYLKNQGYDIVGAEKGKGSVEDGIEFLRSFEKIIIRPRCKGAIDNFTNYKWKVDRITNEILPIPADGSDHWPDAARYGLEKYIKRKVSIFDIMPPR